MIPLPPNISPTDIVQWIGGHHTWFLYEGPGGAMIPSFLVNSSPLKIAPAGGEERAVPPTKVFAHWPMCGAINFVERRMAAYVLRNQKKQYRRTFSAECVRISCPKSAEFPRNRKKPHLGVGDDVRRIFEPTYYSYSEAKELLNGGWFSVAISPSTILQGKKGGPKGVYFHEALAGKITENDVFVPYLSAIKDKVIRQFNGELG